VNTALCTTGPAGASTFFIVPLSAGVPFTFDARGMILPAGTTQALNVILNAGITGNMAVAIKWYEK
jgi:hypothetical protein